MLSLLLFGKRKKATAAQYAAYLNWLTANRGYSSGTLVSSTGNTAGVTGVHIEHVKMALTDKTAATFMYGSPWGIALGTGYFTSDSRRGAIIRHAMPSQAAHDDQCTNLGVVSVQYAAIVTYSPYLSVTRNGGTSSAYGSYSGRRVIDTIYFDFKTGAAMKMDPFNQTGPVLVQQF